VSGGIHPKPAALQRVGPNKDIGAKTTGKRHVRFPRAAREDSNPCALKRYDLRGPNEVVGERGRAVTLLVSR